MNYLNYTLKNGVPTPGKQPNIDQYCKFYPSGNVWSLAGPTFGFMVSIIGVWVDQGLGLLAYDPTLVNGKAFNPNLCNTWGTAFQQADGSYVISIG